MFSEYMSAHFKHKKMLSVIYIYALLKMQDFIMTLLYIFSRYFIIITLHYSHLPFPCWSSSSQISFLLSWLIKNILIFSYFQLCICVAGTFYMPMCAHVPTETRRGCQISCSYTCKQTFSMDAGKQTQVLYKNGKCF